MLLLSFVVLFITTNAVSQSSIPRYWNAIPFMGGGFKQQNTNNNFVYGGVYLDYPFVKSQNWNFGVWGNANRSWFNENLTQYKSTQTETSFGFNTGYYSGFGLTSSVYASISAGIKFLENEGIVNGTNFTSDGHQNDQLVCIGLNYNQYKRLGYFRTQIIVNAQKVLNSQKTLSENQGMREAVESWNNGLFEAIIKQSLSDIPFMQNTSIEPKIGFGYHRYFDGAYDAYSTIIELAFKKPASDDYLTLSAECKNIPGQKANIFLFGLTFNPPRLFKKNNK